MKYINKQILFLVFTLISSSCFARNIDDGHGYDEINGDGITAFFTSEFTIWWFLSLFIIPLVSKILFIKKIERNFKYLTQLNTKSLIRLISWQFFESWAFGGFIGLFVCAWWVLSFSFIGLILDAIGISSYTFDVLSYAMKVPFPYLIFITILIHYFYSVFNEFDKILRDTERNIEDEIIQIKQSFKKLKNR